jgi:uncharacterized delta-60 repeat protein
VVRAIVVGACALTVTAAAGSAAVEPVVVDLDVVSSTNIDAAGCVDLAARSFGSVLPSTSFVSTEDCTIAFGASHGTSQLRASQRDGVGRAMYGTARPRADATFGGSGALLFPHGGGGGNRVTSGARLPDGRLVAGLHVNSGTRDVAVYRFLADGTGGDPTFGTGGVVTTAIGTLDEIVGGVALQPDGMLVVAGGANGTHPNYNDWFLARYEADGDLDPTFGTAGLVTAGFGGNQDEARAVELQPDGKILVAGWTNNPNGAFIARRNADGSNDAAFGTSGNVRWGGANASVHDIELLSDGSILVAGRGTGNSFMLTKFDPAGGFDPTFGTAGVVTLAAGSFNSILRSVDVQPDGTIVASGSSHDGTFERWAIVRLDSEGVPLPGFAGGAGFVLSSFGTTHSVARHAVVEPSGAIVSYGHARNGASDDWSIARHLPDGTPDTSFWSGGVRMVNGLGDESVGTLVPVGDGSVVAIGGSNSYAGVMAMRWAGVSVPQFSSGVTDWTTGSGTFGACLRAIGGDASTNGSTWSPDLADSDCADANADPWRAIVAGSGDPGAVVARATVPTDDALAHLRFGVRVPSDQDPGAYVAPIALEVVSPG